MHDNGKETVAATPSPEDAAASRSQTAYRIIRQEILSARIPPGSKLKIEALQKSSGFSSSPLREALTRLAAEDYVIADQRRGFRVARASLADLHDITHFRLVIEIHAFVESIERGSKAWEEDIVAAYDRLKAAEEQLPRRERAHSEVWIGRHKDFHMALLSASSSPRLRAECSSLFDQSQRYRSLSALQKKGTEVRSGSAEHRRMLEAALDRDKILAAMLLRDHILKTATHVGQYLD